MEAWGHLMLKTYIFNRSQGHHYAQYKITDVQNHGPELLIKGIIS